MVTKRTFESTMLIAIGEFAWSHCDTFEGAREVPFGFYDRIPMMRLSGALSRNSYLSLLKELLQWDSVHRTRENRREPKRTEENQRELPG